MALSVAAAAELFVRERGEGLVTTKADVLESWLADMDDALNALLAEVPKPLAAYLDYSIDSLLPLESWILQRFETFDKAIRREAIPTIDRLGRYVGETIRKSIGGDWEIRTDDPDYAYHGMPQVSGRGLTAAECPQTLVTAATDRRTGRYIFGVVSAMAADAQKKPTAVKPSSRKRLTLPVLKIRRAEGDEALLRHKLTADEKRVFGVFDKATAKLPKDTDLSDYHRVVVKLGEQFGLTPPESIAFWTRTTFMLFEP
jgi:hypothetical protein